MMANKNQDEKFEFYEITIEPKAEVQNDYKFRSLIVNLWAHDILEAIEQAKQLIDIDRDELDAVSAYASHRYNYRQRNSDF